MYLVPARIRQRSMVLLFQEGDRSFDSRTDLPVTFCADVVFEAENVHHKCIYYETTRSDFRVAERE